MNRRPKEPKGKPFLRVPIKKPVPAEPKKKKPAPRRSSKEITQADLDRHARIQGMEQKEAEMMMKKKPMAKGGKVMKHASKAGNAMKKKSADTMGRAMKKYAKGGKVGKADGCATKGKTKGTMVKMAMGGMAGYKRGGKTC
jgi:hypothetical protein